MSFVNEKKGSAVVLEEESTSSPIRRVSTDKLDNAAKFLEDNKDLDVSHIDVTKLRHKIDFRIVPLMCACFIMQVSFNTILCKHMHNYSWFVSANSIIVS
jgi:hypothetical protein